MNHRLASRPWAGIISILKELETLRISKTYSSSHVTVVQFNELFKPQFYTNIKNIKNKPKNLRFWLNDTFKLKCIKPRDTEIMKNLEMLLKTKLCSSYDVQNFENIQNCLAGTYKTI